MRPAEEIEDVVKNMSFVAGPEMDERLWADASRTQGRSKKMRPAPGRDWERKTIMRSPITKFAIAAAVVAVAVLGLSEFISSDAGSGIVWAEVARKVLDDAAVRIVELASPFAPFPDDFVKEIDILHVTRTWKFLNRFTINTASRF